MPVLNRRHVQMVLFFKRKTAYEMRISDWSSDVCSSDLFPGVVVRLGKAFAKVEAIDATTLRCGGGASGILVSSTARDAGIAGLEFLRSIPGTVGGFVRMHGGAYGGEIGRASCRERVCKYV